MKSNKYYKIKRRKLCNYDYLIVFKNCLSERNLESSLKNIKRLIERNKNVINSLNIECSNNDKIYIIDNLISCLKKSIIQIFNIDYETIILCDSYKIRVF